MPEAAIETAGLRKRYGAVEALRGVDLSVAFMWGVVITVVFAALSVWRYKRAVAR